MKDTYSASRVTVVVPTVNRNISLLEALASIEAQTYSDIEVVIVDDASDVAVSSEEVKRALATRSFKIIRNESRMGGATSRNYGINAASGEFICFLDDDDIYLPEKIERLASVLDKNESLGAVFADVRLRDETGYVTLFKPQIRFDRRSNELMMNLIHNNATLIRRSALGKLRFLDGLTRFQDMQFNIELCVYNKVEYIAIDVAEWRVDCRFDKVTAAGDRAKQLRDIAAFEMLVAHFHTRVRLSEDVLAVFYLKLLKMYFNARMYGELVKTLTKNVSLIRHLDTLVRAYVLRKRHFIGRS